MSDNKATDYDKITDKLGGSLIDFNLKMVGLLATLLVKPLALATEVFFRKDFGERYLTQGSALVSAFLWLLAGNLSYLFQNGVNPVITFIYKIGLHRTGEWLYQHDYSHNVGWIMLIAQSWMAGRCLFIVRIRSSSGQMWYSMSRGSSVFGTENRTRDLMIGAAAALILSVFANSLGMLFIVSLCVSQHLAAREQNYLYNRYLDAMDAKIQAEYLQRALDKGEPPDSTDGLYCPLPKEFKGEYRQRVARVVAGGPFDKGVIDVEPDKPQARPRPATAQSSQTETAASPVQEADLKAAFQAATGTVKQSLSSILRSKRVIRFAVVGLLLAACAAVGIPVFRLIQSQIKQSAVVPVAIQPTDASSAVPAQPPSKLQNQTQQSPQVVAPAAQPDNSAALAQAALEAQRRQDEEKAKAQAALEAQKRQEAEQQAALEQQKREARAKLIAEINSTLSNEVASLSKYNADCQARLDDNTNKLAKVALSARKVLTKNNDDFRAQLVKNVQIEADSLNNVLKDMEVIDSHPQFDPRIIRDQLSNYIAEMDAHHKAAISILDELDTAISNAPKKTLFPFLNLKAN